MPYITRAGAQIHYEHLSGRGERAVVLQHPLCSEPGCFEETTLKSTFLQAGYDVILPTSIAHGSSSSPLEPERYRLEERARDVLGLAHPDELVIYTK